MITAEKKYGINILEEDKLGKLRPFFGRIQSKGVWQV
jgi:hypothetical protein